LNISHSPIADDLSDEQRYVDLGSVAHITHNRYQGDRAVTQERFDDIVRWFVQGAA
jgi:hypothetical protein